MAILRITNSACTPPVIGCMEYGYLYNLYAAMDNRNLANTGWHVPVISDTEELIKAICSDWDYAAAYKLNSPTAGGLLKETGLIYWDSPNTGASDNVGFSARGAGIRKALNGTFDGLKTLNRIWIVSNNSGTTWPNIYMAYDDEWIVTDYIHRLNGLSVRLVKDSTTLTHGQYGSYTGNDGKNYRTICIGTQEWLADNLAETRFRDGSLIPIVEDNTEWAALTTAGMCAYNNDYTLVGCGETAPVTTTTTQLATTTTTTELATTTTTTAETFSGTSYFVSSDGTGDGLTELTPTNITTINTTALSPGDAVLLKKGDSFDGTLTITDEGTDGSPITISAYGSGNKPKLYGSDVITGWTLHSGNIWKSTYGAITQLFSNGTRIRPARTPNSGYNFVTSTNGTTTVTSTSLSSGIDYTGAKIFIRTDYYVTEIRTVISSYGTTLTLDSSTRKNIDVGNGFFLMNKLEFLTQASSWYSDGTTVYFWAPGNVNPNTLEVRGSTRTSGIEITGKYVTVKNLEIREQSDNGIKLNGISSYFTCENNYIHSQEGYGFYADTLSSTGEQNTNYSILNNEFRYQNGAGISVRVTDGLIEDNLVQDIAAFAQIGLRGTMEDNKGIGISCGSIYNTSTTQGGGNIIRYNTIKRVGYSGINFSGRNTEVKYNFLQDTVLLRSDNGAIYCSWYGRNANYGVQGSVISNNIILDVEGTAYGYTTASNRKMGHGIYIDENAEGVTVEYNTVSRVSDGCVMLHETQDVTIRHNTLFGGRQGLLLANSYGTTDNSVNNNIVAIYDGVDEDSYYVNELIGYKPGGNFALNTNKYYNAFSAGIGDNVFKYTSGLQSFAQWESGTGETGSTYTPITLGIGETQRLIYNNTKVAKVYDLTGATAKDLDGVSVTELTLQPFTSKILVGTDLELID